MSIYDTDQWYRHDQRCRLFGSLFQHEESSPERSPLQGFWHLNLFVSSERRRGTHAAPRPVQQREQNRQRYKSRGRISRAPCRFAVVIFLPVYHWQILHSSFTSRRPHESVFLSILCFVIFFPFLYLSSLSRTYRPFEPLNSALLLSFLPSRLLVSFILPLRLSTETRLHTYST